LLQEFLDQSCKIAWPSTLESIIVSPPSIWNDYPEVRAQHTASPLYLTALNSPTHLPPSLREMTFAIPFKRIELVHKPHLTYAIEFAHHVFLCVPRTGSIRNWLSYDTYTKTVEANSMFSLDQHLNIHLIIVCRDDLA
jgi:hypothetical protein